MKKILAISGLFLLMLAIPAKDFTALAWNCWYLINKDYVARELCVNKAKPKLHCNGKCHLAKQLKKLEDPSGNDKKPVSAHFKAIELNWIAHKPTAIPVLYKDFTPNEKHFWHSEHRAPHSVSIPVFHPPCL